MNEVPLYKQLEKTQQDETGEGAEICMIAAQTIEEDNWTCSALAPTWHI